MAMQVVLSIPPLVSTMADREFEVVESEAVEMNGTAGVGMSGLYAMQADVLNTEIRMTKQ